MLQWTTAEFTECDFGCTCSYNMPLEVCEGTSMEASTTHGSHFIYIIHRSIDVDVKAFKRHLVSGNVSSGNVLYRGM